MNFHQLTITSKLTIAFSVLVGMLLGVCVLSVYSLSEAQKDFDGFVSDELSRGGLARDVRAAASARAISARNLIVLNGPEDVKAETEAVKVAHARVQERLALLVKSVAETANISSEEKALLEKIVSLETRYGPVALDIVNLALTGKKEEAIAKMNAECQPLLKQLITATTDYSRLIAASGAQEIKRSAERFSFKESILIISSVVAIVVAILLSTLINRSLMRSLGADPLELSAAAKRVASGNLGPVPQAATSPAGSVLESLGEMQAALANIVSRVRTSASYIESGAREIASGSAELSQRTEQQIDNIQRSSSSTEQMTATVKQNSQTAQEASQLATSARSAAEHGGTVASQVMSTMEEITQSSRQISEIISVIDGIAFQTNILALNAAVEAARAGEQGRGFAVVAAEVRSLAQRSAQAAREIKALIQASVERVDAGSGLVNTAGSAMTEIVGEVKVVADLIGEINGATLEQTTGINHISKAVAELDQSTQQNAALVQELATAASTLNQQAHGLVEAVSVFQLPDGQISANAPRHLAIAPQPTRLAPRLSDLNGSTTSSTRRTAMNEPVGEAELQWRA